MRRNELDDDDPDNPFDQNGVLKDGRSIRVPMLFRDGERANVQRGVGDEARRRAIADSFADAERRREQARQVWVDSLQWRPPEERAKPRDSFNAGPGTGSLDASAARTSDYPTSTGEARVMLDIAEAERRREAAYQDYRRSLNDGSRAR